MIKVLVKLDVQRSIRLFLMGMVICEFFFGLTGITAMYNNTFCRSGEPLIPTDNIRKGQKIMVEKCIKCHTLERIYTIYKTDAG